METTDVILIGAGGHAKVVLDCLQTTRRKVVALFDKKQEGELMGVPVKGVYNRENESHAVAIVAIGDNAVRKRVVNETHHAFTTTIHDSAVFSESAVVGEGSMVLHGAIVQAQAVIGRHVIINTKSQVDHDCIISDYVHIGPGAVLCGTVRVGEGAFVGAGAVVVPEKKIGKWAIVGAGAVVVDDVPDFAVVVGNPARIIKYSNL